MRGRPNRALATALPWLLLLAVATAARADEFAEGNASEWATFASDAAATSTADDSTLVKAGLASVRFDTQSGFDTGVIYPGTGSAAWDLSGKTHFQFWAYAVNDNQYGFQGSQPVVVLETPTGSARYEPTSTLMYNRVWHLYKIPLAGDSTWIRTDTGAPDLADVERFEIHNDTWDYGFTIYFDGVEFVNIVPGQLPPPGPPPPPGVDPDAIEARALLWIFDPVMENKGGVRMHEAYGWLDPVALTQQVIADLETSSHSRARYAIAETIVVDDYPFFEDGYRYDDETYDVAWTTSTWHPSIFDYARFIADANIAKRIESGEIDEVWVYGGPGFGMWESTMAGDGGYWCNSSPVLGVPSERLFVVMGWNFERGVAEAIHSYGHRTESVMVHSYGPWQPNRDNNWNAFTLIDMEASNQGSVGDVHFPVNGTSDYDYYNAQRVRSDADDWYNYPDLTGQRRWVDSSDWSPDGADPHRQYLNWWYDHLPHMTGRGHDYFLANWWRYVVDVDQFKGWDGNLELSPGLPTVAIYEPADAAPVSGTVRVRVRALVDGALGRVDLYVDGAYHESDYLAPYEFRWDGSAASGPVALEARAYELQNGTEAVSAPVTVTVSAPAAVPAEVSPPGSSNPLVFVDGQTLAWEPASVSGAERFNLYRGNVDWLVDGLFGSCFAADLTTNSAADPESPWPGGAWFYLVTGETSGGEGTRGSGTGGSSRSGSSACY